jgi:hypothetical protein
MGSVENANAQGDLFLMRKLSGILLLLVLFGSGVVMAQDATATPAAEESLPPPDGSATPIFVNPLLGLPIAPPIEIDLPDGWLYGYDTILYNEVDGTVDSVPFALYTGDVSGGQGTIVMVWGYDSVTTGIEFDPNFGVVNPWLDGLRILRAIIFDPRCNIGTAPRRDYSVGELPASGTTFNVVGCPANQPDTRGWFAALNVDSINFAFYIYIDPLPPAGSPAEAELQRILDTVKFNVADLIVSPEQWEATRQALLLTPFITPSPTPAQ